MIEGNRDNRGEKARKRNASSFTKLFAKVSGKVIDPKRLARQCRVNTFSPRASALVATVNAADANAIVGEQSGPLHYRNRISMPWKVQLYEFAEGKLSEYPASLNIHRARAESVKIQSLPRHMLIHSNHAYIRMTQQKSKVSAPSGSLFSNLEHYSRIPVRTLITKIVLTQSLPIEASTVLFSNNSTRLNKQTHLTNINRTNAQTYLCCLIFGDGVNQRDRSMLETP